MTRSILPVLALLVGGLAPGAAEAALQPLTLEQLTDASDYIVRGTVSSTWVEVDDRGVHWTRVQLEVDEVYRGPAELDALELTVMGGIQGGEGTLVHDAPRFDEQEPVLVFAEVLESGIVTPTGLQYGKYTVRIDPDSGREMLVRFNPTLGFPYDHRFIPHPPAAERLYLADIEARIRARVRAGWDGRPIVGKSMERLRVLHPEVEVNP